MSDVTPILTSVVDLKRFTAYVLDQQAIAASLAASRQPGTSGNMEITIQGGIYNNGLVSISGNVVEQIAFTADGAKVGIQNFSSISGITIAGITGGTIKVKAVSDMGQPIEQLLLIMAGLTCRFFQQTGTILEGPQGQQQVAKRLRTGLMLERGYDIRANDQVWSDYGMVGLTMFTVDFVEQLYDFAGATHHTEAWLLPI